MISAGQPHRAAAPSVRRTASRPSSACQAQHRGGLAGPAAASARRGHAQHQPRGTATHRLRARPARRRGWPGLHVKEGGGSSGLECGCKMGAGRENGGRGGSGEMVAPDFPGKFNPALDIPVLCHPGSAPIFFSCRHSGWHGHLLALRGVSGGQVLVWACWVAWRRNGRLGLACESGRGWAWKRWASIEGEPPPTV
jgi:hypothetical protein